MNKIILIGRATSNIELRYTSNNKPVANFSIAVQRNYKNEDGENEADFINCVAFNKLAETISSYIKKGDKLGLEGRLQVRTYDNAEGKKVYVSEVIVENIEFLESKNKVETKEETNKCSYDPFKEFHEEHKEELDNLPF